MKTKVKYPYNPGTPKEIMKTGRGAYLVQSFKGDDSWYLADLEAGTCTCPDHAFRQRTCKHLKLAEAESRRETLEKARTMPLSDLQALSLTKYRPEVSEAIKQAIFEKSSSIPAQLEECGEDDPAWAAMKQVEFKNGVKVTAYYTKEQLAQAA